MISVQGAPAIMNAGGSERGRHFACKHADMVYTVIRNTDPDLNRKHVQAYHALLHDKLPGPLAKSDFEVFFNRFDPFKLCMVLYIIIFVRVTEPRS